MLDFRSDTVTKPTKEMMDAIINAELGDDVYGDDPTVNELQKMASELLGKESAIFVPSGTFSNQLAIITHTNRGDEIICLEDSHILQHESGAASLLSSVNIRSARSIDGEYDLEELENLFRENDIHHPITSLVCTENAHGNGRVIDTIHLQKVKDISNKKGVKVHLDGARLFNAASFLDIDPKEIAKTADTVSICLSKGLCSPIGSLLLGEESFINKAKRYRKAMGGGLRQAGILAACGIVSLEKMTKRLSKDHDLANYFAVLIDDIDKINVKWGRSDINMIFFEYLGDIDLSVELLKRDILINPKENNEYRICTHNNISKKDIDCLVLAIKEIIFD